MEPLVSIIIPTYNRAHLIKETLNSILAQSYINWECIIVDDGSKDNINKILEAYLTKDKRFSYYQRPNTHKKGPSGCRNYGFSLSRGAYINWFDSDDIMMSQKLQTEINLLENGNYDFAISQTQYFETNSKQKLGFWNDKLFSGDSLNDFIMQKIGWSVNAPLWKRESLVHNNLLFDERLFNGDDYYYHIRALILKLKPVVVNNVHSLVRIHPDRIEEFGYKAHSKSIITLDLLKNRKTYDLSQACIQSQKDLSFYLLKNMYKHKKLRDGLYWSKELVRLDMRFGLKRICFAFFVGLFYKITGRGYSNFNKV